MGADDWAGAGEVNCAGVGAILMGVGVASDFTLKTGSDFTAET